MKILPEIILTMACLSFFALVGNAKIPGFQTGLNANGMNFFGGTYIPITTTGLPGTGQFKQEYVDGVLKVFKPKDEREMDYWQIVTNPTTTWASRSQNDTSTFGITYETTINLENTLLTINPGFVPYLNSPTFADIGHDFSLGVLYGQNYHGKRIIFSKGNEGWNIFGNNLPSQSLTIARQDYPGVGDFQAAGMEWGKRLGQGEVAFEAGVHSVRPNVEVDMEIEGFAPTTAWAQYQIAGMKGVGIDPAQHHGRLAIAQYAAGSATDLQGPTATNDQKKTALLNFINNSLVAWTKQHRQLAEANGLADVVDAYEIRLGTPGGATTQDWKDFQNSPQMAQVMAAGYQAIFDASGGKDAFLNQEGFVGFPWDNGIFSLADWPSQIGNPGLSQAWQGLLNQIDFSSINTPEPDFNLIAFGCWLITLSWRSERKGKICNI